MIHLTLTGCGSAQERVLCQTQLPGTDTCWHAMYTTQAQRERPDMCPQCKTLWETEEEAQPYGALYPTL